MSKVVRDKAEYQYVCFLFRELRTAWFNAKLLSRPPEREFEDEEREAMRIKSNIEDKQSYDLDTEAILQGKNRNIVPTCLADIGPKENEQ